MIAVMPTGSKPSKAASKDSCRPVICRGELVNEDGSWSLVTTDSFILSVLPLTVVDEDNGRSPELIPGPISYEAMLAIEKTGAFTANGTVDPWVGKGEWYTYEATGASFARETDPAYYPDHRQLIPTDEPVVTIKINPTLLANLVAAQGFGGKNGELTLTISGADRPIRLSRNGGEATALIMPVRIKD